MAATAFQTIYKQEYIDGYEIRQSLLRSAVTTAAQIRGNNAVFLVADSGGATAVTRGVNGLIPARSDNLTQVTCSLAEYHDLPQRTAFNVDSSQGDGRRIMQETSMGVMNRTTDSLIIGQLDTATNDTGAAVKASVKLVVKALTILGTNEVPISEEQNMFGVISPAFHGYMMETTQYASADYVSTKPFDGPARPFRRWMGINWIVHPNLTGGATATEKCYLFHRNAIGHAVNKDMDVRAGYDEQQDYYWARVSMFMGSKLIQNSGVVQMLHDGSEYVAS